ncbi:pyridoxamine 5'-phosphate oxidase family protein [uncultured Microbulbifer sp.]|uniref:pyridoxamine 5'-phosphate oxidase family protein n=1 Tax=uncultured Microbulbifer sp. TaxID=348147 RepID=UPI0026198058|nr:pyridoxamine 5'-phosphate oxidase family protein [uncultured Microbulbifer sp.]
MATQFPELEGAHIEFIKQQHIYFVATAGAEGYVNNSPKGMDSFRIINSKQIAWLNLTGSGNESAAHVLENGRMTIMFCSFGKQPLILRLYGNARVYHKRDAEWQDYSELFPTQPGARQIFVVDLAMVQTSCGFAVPYFEFVSDRPTLAKWAENTGDAGIEAYWQKKNTKSLDGKDTGIR